MNDFPLDLRHGSGAPMALDRTRLLLILKEPLERRRMEALLQKLGFALEETAGNNSRKSSRAMESINHTDQRYWVRLQEGGRIDSKLSSSLERNLGDILDFIAPAYQMDGVRGRNGILCPLPHVLLVKMASESKKQVRAMSSALATELAVDPKQSILTEVVEKSKYLGDYRYFVINQPREHQAYALHDILKKSLGDQVLDVRFENMPLLVPTAATPNDPLYPQQWGMTQIQAGGAGTTGWDISTGDPSVVVCVLDSGCDLTHPDLQFSEPGINLDTMLPDGSPTGRHGTACAGIVAGNYNSGLGVAGVAGSCEIMPLAFLNWTDVEVAAGINYAADNGAQVISMSFGWDPWDPAIIDPAIQHAFDLDVVMCVATHNYNSAITYPATNPLVMACGASDQVDNRKSPSSPDGEGWGSNFGPEISVVAPGVLIPTTDRQGNLGYNSSPGTAGDYALTFNGTSAATPHVAGLAALIRSEYPTLSNVEVRGLIERTAEKVGTTAYADASGYANGTWNQEMGYGRINAYRALDFADVMIKDNPSDTGAEPSTGNFWNFSDIVVRITDDDVFAPEDPGKSKNVERGQTNYIYMRVTNHGPREARNVVVNARITPYVGLQFLYPTDWTSIDANHVSPTPVVATFASIPAGGTVMAKFTISAAQVEDLWGWTDSGEDWWHPCLLAEVTADNDYAFASASLTGNALSRQRNNLAQRNLSVIDVLAGGASAAFPFLAGNLRNAQRMMDLVIDRSLLPKEARLLLSLDDDGKAFPQVNFGDAGSTPKQDCSAGMVFLDRTRLETTLGCCPGILTLERGSRFDCPPPAKIDKLEVLQGGVVILKDGRRYLEVREDVAILRMEKQPNQLIPFSLQANFPADAKQGESYLVDVSQRDAREETVGGASVVFHLR